MSPPPVTGFLGDSMATQAKRSAAEADQSPIKAMGAAIRALEVGKSVSLMPLRNATTDGTGGARAGSLEARKLVDGAVMFYWRKTVDGKAYRAPIGVYDPAASPTAKKSADGEAFSINAAIERAKELIKADQAAESVGGLRKQRELDKTAREAAEKQRAADAAALRLAEERKATYTLYALLDDYGNQLVALGRGASDVRSMRRLHVPAAVGNLPAADVTSTQLTDMLRGVTVKRDRGHEGAGDRLRAKLRTSLHAAFAMACNSASDYTVPVKFKEYGVRQNPVSSVKNVGGNNSGKDPLSEADMRGYWALLGDARFDCPQGRAARLALLLGGQRIEQLCRAKVSDLDLTNGVITLYDGKGRPKSGAKAQARPHPLPLFGPALDEVKALSLDGDYLFSTDGGKTHIAPKSLGHWLKVKKGVGAKLPDFQLKRVRSGVETWLAGQRVSKDTRGRLQSHGVGGVQDAHYDAHDYMDVKTEALQLLHDLLQGRQRVKVVALRAA